MFNDVRAFTFIAYLLIVLLVAVVAYFVTKNLSDFVLGGRKLGGPVAALSAGASDMSAWLLMGLPGVAFLYGFNQIWLPIGLTLGCYISWGVIAKPLRVYSEFAKDSITLPSFLENRFHDEKGVIRAVLAVATLFFFAVYTSSGLVGGARLLEQFGLGYYDGLLLGTAIIVCYTFVGGFLAVSWTDFFQGTFMFLCLMAVPIIATYNFGGIDNIIAASSAQSVFLLNPFQNINAFLFMNLFAWGLGYFGQPHILVRYMAVSSTKVIPTARRIAIGWMGLSMLGATLTGIVGNAYFVQGQIHHESIFILFSEKLFSAWFTGILFAAILSTIMCAIDSQMLASSSALTEDIYHKWFRKKATQKELMWIGRIAIVAIAAVAVVLASNAGNTVIDLVGFAWAGLGSAFGPVVILSLYWSRITRNGAVSGVVVGALTVILWKAARTYIGGDLLEVYEILPGFIFGFITIITVSLLGKKPDQKIITDFNQAWQLIRNQ
jgi:sodium/proline symporter